MAQAKEDEDPEPKGIPLLSELSKTEKRTTLSWWGKSGRLEMNPVALKKIIEDEGFSFVDFRSDAPVFAVDDSSTKGAVSYTPARKEDVHAIGYLMKAGEYSPLKLHGASTKQYIVSWLECSLEIDCFICWEEGKGGDPNGCGGVLPLKDEVLLCPCGKCICFSCVLDLALLRADGLSYVCPNCTKVRLTLDNVIPFIETVLGLPSLEGLSDEQKQLLYEWTAYGGSKDRKRVEAAHSALQSGFTAVSLPKVLKYGKHWRKHQALTKSERSQVENILKAALRKLDQKKVDSAASSAVPKRASRNGCANCGKSFWDKKAWMRAPKCTKCRRVAYCNGKCRKKHAKAHLKECAAVAKPKRKRKKKPKKREGCAPY